MSARSLRAFLKAVVPPGEFRDPLLDLRRTPERMARAWKTELLRGYGKDAERDLNVTFRTFPYRSEQSQLIVEQGIAFTSTCGHHMLPFMGKANIGYIPDGRVVGLSKIPRVLDHFSAMLQVQERLGEQVADFLYNRLTPIAVVVHIQATHLCMECRGVRKSDVVTHTVALRGAAIDNPEIKSEFFGIINRG